MNQKEVESQCWKFENSLYNILDSGQSIFQNLPDSSSDRELSILDRENTNTNMFCESTPYLGHSNFLKILFHVRAKDNSL